MLCQYGFELVDIRWAAGVHDSSSLLKEIRAEQGGGDHREHLGIGLARIIEAVDRSARDEMRFSWAISTAFPFTVKVMTPSTP